MTRTTVSEFIIRRNFVKTLEEIYYCVVTLPEKCTKLRETFEEPRDKIWGMRQLGPTWCPSAFVCIDNNQPAYE